ncbi:MAG: proton-conducting transporter membrane subunit [Flavobacteriales bacterium]
MFLLIPYLVLLPLTGFVVSLFIPGNRETLISRVAFGTTGIHFVCSMLFTIWWLSTGHVPADHKFLVLYQHGTSEFYVDFCFDKITAVYFLVGSLLAFLVTIYSRYYLHREPGYKRFFNTVLFFYSGYTIVIFSGNLETLFIGWEILGISSFLLIAFYRERYLPVKNAIKVFSLYRIADVGIILAMWLLHDLFHESMTFMRLHEHSLVQEHVDMHPYVSITISLLILITAAVKSAQLPFSSWLPRAMEGPTPSSAIFYGSLSVHIGVFLLLRTFPFWENQLSVRIIVALTGVFTAILATGIARVQSTVKSQIAYSSVAQIGLIFLEIACGFETLALVHFAGNAFLRTYQLLVSPSVVSYLIREQFYNYTGRPVTPEDWFPKKVQYTLYMLSLKEWNLDRIMYGFLWSPIKIAGHAFDFLSLRSSLFLFIPLFVVGVISLYHQEIIPASIRPYLPEFFSFIGLLMVLKSFIGRKNVRTNWAMIMMNHFWIALAVSFNAHVTYMDNLIYLSGIFVSGIVGFICLWSLSSSERKVDLDKFQGHVHQHPVAAFVFFMACLGLTGFPITPTFIGEDLIFGHIQSGQTVLAFFVSASLIIDGIAAMRVYARVFMGPHVKSIHEMGYRSS